jgi:hypothetical protein
MRPATRLRAIEDLEFRFQRRKYPGNAFYTWAFVKDGEEWVSLGDPWPAVHWPSQELLKAGKLALQHRRKEKV